MTADRHVFATTSGVAGKVRYLERTVQLFHVRGGTVLVKDAGSDQCEKVECPLIGGALVASASPESIKAVMGIGHVEQSDGVEWLACVPLVGLDAHELAHAWLTGKPLEGREARLVEESAS